MYDRIITVEALVAIQARRGLTTTELARRSGVSRSMITDVRGGRFQFSDALAHRIAATLGCTVDDFSRPLTPTEHRHRAARAQHRRDVLARNRPAARDVA